MTATNHVTAGALIAVVIKQPYAALPLALLSHVVMDSLPHFGWRDHKSKTFFMILMTDMLCASLVLLSIILLQPAHWPLLLACGVLAAAPDLLWLYYLIFELKGRPKPLAPIARFLAYVQWCELQSWTGFFIEAGWFVVTGLLLINLL